MQKLKQAQRIIYLLVVLSLASVACARTNIEATPSQPAAQPDELVVSEQKEVGGTIRLVNDGDSRNFDYQVDEGSSVFDLMKKLSEEGKFELAYQESSIGVFIESINGVENNAADELYWMFYVNDKMANVGASDYQLADGDIIEWRYIDTSQVDF